MRCIYIVLVGNHVNDCLHVSHWQNVSQTLPTLHGICWCVCACRDDVEWGEDQRREAEEKVEENSKQPVPAKERGQLQELFRIHSLHLPSMCSILPPPPPPACYESGAADYWDSFYQQHQNRFFKDRHWLFTEFPELREDTRPADQAGKLTIWEVWPLTANLSVLLSSLSRSLSPSQVGCGAGNTVFPILQTRRSGNLLIHLPSSLSPLCMPAC